METTRRNLLRNGFLSAAALLTLPKLAKAQTAQCLIDKTPAQTEGPFYPVVDQVDTDADLIKVNGRNKIADGEIVIVQGVLTDQHCSPVPGALVEIWQACKTGRYNHPSEPNPAPLDPNFQYWGKAVTDEKGGYRFRTIIPGAYQADVDWMRPPHIHFKISKLRYKELITQMYFSGNQLNADDKILQQLKAADQEKVIVPFETIANEAHPVGQFNIQIEKI